MDWKKMLALFVFASILLSGCVDESKSYETYSNDCLSIKYPSNLGIKVETHKLDVCTLNITFESNNIENVNKMFITVTQEEIPMYLLYMIESSQYHDKPKLASEFKYKKYDGLRILGNITSKDGISLGWGRIYFTNTEEKIIILNRFQYESSKEEYLPIVEEIAESIEIKHITPHNYSVS